MIVRRGFFFFSCLHPDGETRERVDPELQPSTQIHHQTSTQASADRLISTTNSKQEQPGPPTSVLITYSTTFHRSTNFRPSSRRALKAEPPRRVHFQAANKICIAITDNAPASTHAHTNTHTSLDLLCAESSLSSLSSPSCGGWRSSSELNLLINAILLSSCPARARPDHPHRLGVRAWRSAVRKVLCATSPRGRKRRSQVSQQRRSAHPRLVVAF